MSTQRSLFDPVQAHTHDPVTSHLAADKLESSGSGQRGRDLVKAELRKIEAAGGEPPTACELAAGANWPDEREPVQLARKRLNDLHQLGEVEQLEHRTCKVRGSRQVTWRTV